MEVLTHPSQASQSLLRVQPDLRMSGWDMSWWASMVSLLCHSPWIQSPGWK